LGYGPALLIGLFQAFAILPGISRSGTTIVAGLGCGLRRDEAATFSFLLAIPAIGGAGLLELKDLLSEPAGHMPLGALALGALVSFVVGLLSLCWLIRWLQKGRLHLFAWWVIPLGLAVIAWRLL
jgi:undecaprenyl-diphosphatase